MYNDPWRRNILFYSILFSDTKGLFVKVQRTPIAMIWTEGQQVKTNSETTRKDSKEGHKKIRDLIIQMKVN
jgi:hypothetical protein